MNESLKLDNQLCFPLYAAAREVINLYTPHLKLLGLTYTQYIVLLVLWEKDGVLVKDIAERLYLDTGTLTPLLKKLEEAGYINKTKSRRDERAVLISLTKKGKALEEEVKSIPESIGKCIPLEADEARMLYALLYKVLNGKG